MSSSTTKTTFDNAQISRQTLEILNTNSLHFISISLLFLPLTYLALVINQFYISSSTFWPDVDVTTFFEPFNLHIIKLIIANSHNLITIKFLTKTLVIIIFIIFPTIIGISLITYSTNQAIHHKPLTFSSTLKSLSRSFIHLFSTIIAGSIQLIFIYLVFTLSPVALTHSIKALGFHFDQFILSIITNTITSYGLLITIVFYMVIWGSAASIAVLESKSGFEPLKQSANQSKEFRSRSFFLLFFAGYLIGPSLSIPVNAYIIKSTTNWIICVIYLQTSLMILFYVVANTVLYVQFKVACDEDQKKTTVDGDVSGEYVKVAVNERDDDDVGVLNELAKGDSITNGGFNYIMYMLCAVWIVILFSMFFKMYIFAKYELAVL